MKATRAGGGGLTSQPGPGLLERRNTRVSACSEINRVSCLDTGENVTISNDTHMLADCMYDDDNNIFTREQ